MPVAKKNTHHKVSDAKQCRCVEKCDGSSPESILGMNHLSRGNDSVVVFVQRVAISGNRSRSLRQLVYGMGGARGRRVHSL